MVSSRVVRGLAWIAMAAVVTSCDEDVNNIVTLPTGRAGALTAARTAAVGEIAFSLLSPGASGEILIAADLASLEIMRATIARGGTVTNSTTVQATLLSVVTFSLAPGGANGTRYVRATFGIRNQLADAVINRNNPNLLVIPLATSQGVAATEFRSLTTANGAAADPNIARQITPTNVVRDNGAGQVVDLPPEILVRFTATERAAVPAVTGALGSASYGFTVFPATSAFPQFDELVTVAWAIPKQTNASEDATTASVHFVILARGQ